MSAYGMSNHAGRTQGHVCILCFSLACGIMTLVGALLWADKQQHKDYLNSLDPDVDFPLVGNATISRLWNRPTINRESCGEYCDLDVW